MHPGEAPFMEKVVHGPRRFGTDAERGAILVRTRPQVGDGTQKFVRMPLFLQRESLRISAAEDLYGHGADLPLLPLARRGHQLAADGERRAGGRLAKTGVRRGSRIHDALDIGQA